MYEHRPLYPLPWWQQSYQAQNNKCPPPLPPLPCPGDEFIIRFLGIDCDGNALFCLKRKPSNNCGLYPKPYR